MVVNLDTSTQLLYAAPLFWLRRDVIEALSVSSLSHVGNLRMIVAHFHPYSSHGLVVIQLIWRYFASKWLLCDGLHFVETRQLLILVLNSRITWIIRGSLTHHGAVSVCSFFLEMVTNAFQAISAYLIEARNVSLQHLSTRVVIFVRITFVLGGRVECEIIGAIHRLVDTLPRHWEIRNARVRSVVQGGCWLLAVDFIRVNRAELWSC